MSTKQFFIIISQLTIVKNIPTASKKSKLVSDNSKQANFQNPSNSSLFGIKFTKPVISKEKICKIENSQKKICLQSKINDFDENECVLCNVGYRLEPQQAKLLSQKKNDKNNFLSTIEIKPKMDCVKRQSCHQPGCKYCQMKTSNFKGFIDEECLICDKNYFQFLCKETGINTFQAKLCFGQNNTMHYYNKDENLKKCVLKTDDYKNQQKNNLIENCLYQDYTDSSTANCFQCEAGYILHENTEKKYNNCYKKMRHLQEDLIGCRIFDKDTKSCFECSRDTSIFEIDKEYFLKGIINLMTKKTDDQKIESMNIPVVDTITIIEPQTQKNLGKFTEEKFENNVEKIIDDQPKFTAFFDSKNPNKNTGKNSGSLKGKTVPNIFDAKNKKFLQGL